MIGGAEGLLVRSFTLIGEAQLRSISIFGFAFSAIAASWNMWSTGLTVRAVRNSVGFCEMSFGSSYAKRAEEKNLGKP